MAGRLKSYDLIRAVSALCIVFFHFSYALISNGLSEGVPVFFQYANGDFGAVFVAVFFMLSGAVLHLGWKDKLKGFNGEGGIISFYKKRALSIFPAFYIAWAAMYALKVLMTKKPFWGGHPLKILLSIFGMDGYISFFGEDYYSVGEWFLGALILLYLLFPFMEILLRKSVFALMLPSAVLFFVSVRFIASEASFLLCVFYFSCGMVFEKYKKIFTGKICMALSFALLPSVMFMYLPIGARMASTLLAFSLFVCLYGTGEIFCGNSHIRDFLSRYSYEIFLAHHVTVDLVCAKAAGKGSGSLFAFILLCVSAAFTAMSAVVLNKLSKGLVYCIRRYILISL